MFERTVDIETADGTMPIFVTCPESGGPFAPVVLFMDIWGFRELLCDIARRIGTVGYAAVVPNLYYREGGVNFDSRRPDGRTRSLTDVPKEEQEKVYAVARHLTDDMVIADGAALLDFFDSDEAIRGGPVGSIGWCMGGRHVIRAAGAHPERFRATIGLHPTRLVGEDEPTAPYRDAPNAKARSISAVANRTLTRLRRSSRRSARHSRPQPSASSRSSTRARGTAMPSPTATCSTSTPPRATGNAPSPCTAGFSPNRPRVRSCKIRAWPADCR